MVFQKKTIYSLFSLNDVFKTVGVFISVFSNKIDEKYSRLSRQGNANHKLLFWPQLMTRRISFHARKGCHRRRNN